MVMGHKNDASLENCHILAQATGFFMCCSKRSNVPRRPQDLAASGIPSRAIPKGARSLASWVYILLYVGSPLGVPFFWWSFSASSSLAKCSTSSRCTAIGDSLSLVSVTWQSGRSILRSYILEVCDVAKNYKCLPFTYTLMMGPLTARTVSGNCGTKE